MSNQELLNKKAYKSASVAWMVNNPVAANLLMLFFVIGGYIAQINMVQEVFPPMDMDTVNISLSYSGATPEEIEQGIVRPIEEAVRGLDGVKDVTSTVRAGAASVRVDALDGVNRDDLLQDVQATINRINTFPSDMTKPVVTAVSRRVNAVTLVLTGSEDPQVLREWADIIRDELTNDPGITQVELDGVQKREIIVEISQENLRRYGLTLTDVSTALRSASVEQGAGTIRSDSGDIQLLLTNKLNYASDFAKTSILTDSTGKRVLLEDIATVDESFADSTNLTRFNGKLAVLIDVYRIGKQTPQSVSRATLNQMELINQTLPGELQLDLLSDSADIFTQRATMLMKNAAMGMILVFASLMLFLDMKLAFWVSLGIPISILGSFLFLNPLGTSINMMSMFAFIVTLGIVVDDAIVVGENVYRWKRMGYSSKDAAIYGTSEVTTPVIFSILTNIVAFAPILLVSGMAGRMFAAIAPVVMIVFACSLIESIYVLPAHLAYSKPIKKTGITGFISNLQANFSRGFERWIEYRYAPFLELVLRYRYIMFASCLALLIICGAYVFSGRLGFEVMPSAESDMAYVQVVLPTGSSTSKINEVLDQLEKGALELVAENGQDELSIGIFSSTRGSTVSSRIYLTAPEVRPLKTSEVVSIWREKTGTILGAESIQFQSDRGGPGSGSKALTVRLTHSDVDTLELAAADLADRLNGIEKVSDADTGASKRNRQYNIILKELGEQLNLSSRTIADQVRASFEGSTALKQQRGRDEITIKVRLPESDRKQSSTLENIVLLAPNKQEVLLRDAAEIEETLSYAVIRRVNSQRTLDVTADVTPKSDASQVQAVLDNEIMPELLANYPGLNYNYGGMQQELSEGTSSLIIGLVLVLLAIYVLLAIPFKSYSQPALIMTAIPFGMVGAIIGHIIMGYKLSMISMIGVLALSGVVINDALVLIDFANQRRLEGLSAHKAMRMAGIQRFRAVLLTTVTTFFGLCPMILEKSMQAVQLIPVAISLGFGVLFGTVITLALIPALYLILEDIKHYFGLVERKSKQEKSKITVE